MRYLEFTDGRRVVVKENGFVELFDGVEVLVPENAESGDRWCVEVTPFVEDNHLAGCNLGDSVFIANHQRLLSEIKGNLVQTQRDTKETEGWSDLSSKVTEDMRSTLMSVHYNHIFMAKNRTLYWTDLDNIWNWYPRPNNEADFRVIEWEKDDITALSMVNDVLFIHFPTAVYVCEYIGKPTVVRISQRNEGHGAVSQRSLVVHKNSQFYMGVDNFYQWSPVEGVIPIGEEVWKRLREFNIDEIFAYVDRVNREICWCVGDSIWAFNYIERHWSRYSSACMTDHLTVPITNSVSLETALTTNTNSYRKVNTGLYNLWCGKEGLFKKFDNQGNLANLLPRKSPYLITDEQTYGDIFGEKDVDKIVIDGAYGVGYDGFCVEVAAKEYVSDPDIYRDFDHWRHERHFKQADSKKHSGRSFKFKFTIIDKVAKWDGKYLSEGHTFYTGVEPIVWNGRYKLDGKHKLSNLHQGLWDGGTLYVDGQLRLDLAQFRVYAWGERVMLPKPETGDDK